MSRAVDTSTNFTRRLAADGAPAVTARFLRGVRLGGALWVLGVSTLGASLSLTPAIFLIPVALVSVVVWRSSGSPEWSRAWSLTALVLLWLFAAVASASVGTLYLPGLIALVIARPWSEQGVGAHNSTRESVGR